MADRIKGLTLGSFWVPDDFPGVVSGEIDLLHRRDRWEFFDQNGHFTSTYSSPSECRSFTEAEYLSAATV